VKKLDDDIFKRDEEQKEETENLLKLKIEVDQNIIRDAGDGLSKSVQFEAKFKEQEKDDD
jgi:hypothetical protein